MMPKTQIEQAIVETRLAIEETRLLIRSLKASNAATDKKMANLKAHLEKLRRDLKKLP